jgi:hypothetical protein
MVQWLDFRVLAFSLGEEFINDTKTQIVSGVLIFLTRIAQACDQLDHDRKKGLTGDTSRD